MIETLETQEPTPTEADFVPQSVVTGENDTPVTPPNNDKKDNASGLISADISNGTRERVESLIPALKIPTSDKVLLSENSNIKHTSSARSEKDLPPVKTHKSPRLEMKDGSTHDVIKSDPAGGKSAVNEDKSGRLSVTDDAGGKSSRSSGDKSGRVATGRRPSASSNCPSPGIPNRQTAVDNSAAKVNVPSRRRSIATPSNYSALDMYAAAAAATEAAARGDFTSGVSSGGPAITKRRGSLFSAPDPYRDLKTSNTQIILTPEEREEEERKRKELLTTGAQSRSLNVKTSMDPYKDLKTSNTAFILTAEEKDEEERKRKELSTTGAQSRTLKVKTSMDPYANMKTANALTPELEAKLYTPEELAVRTTKRPGLPNVFRRASITALDQARRSSTGGGISSGKDMAAAAAVAAAELESSTKVADAKETKVESTPTT